MRNVVILAAASLAAIAMPSAAQAQTAPLTSTTGNACTDGGIDTCVATQTGVINGTSTDPLASSLIARIEFNSDTGAISNVDVSSLFGSVSGSEFNASFDSNNMLTFTYTPDAGDPAIHYYGLFQANTYDLFYSANEITSLNINLSDYFAEHPGLSHIDVYDTTMVPEPATWAMMMLGFGAVGYSLRRRRKLGLTQVA